MKDLFIKCPKCKKCFDLDKAMMGKDSIKINLERVENNKNQLRAEIEFVLDCPSCRANLLAFSAAQKFELEFKFM